MKQKLLLVLVLIMVWGIYAFASHRFETRTVSKIDIKFLGKADPLISESNVNKLLIQKSDTTSRLYLEKLALNESELRLVSNAMIRNAEVSVSLDGALEVIVEQREPIARIMGDPHQYLDRDNKIMPLSGEHSVRVPLVYGFSKKAQDEIYELMMFLHGDAVLEQSFSSIKIQKEKGFVLLPRAYSFEVVLGNTNDLDLKLKKYKAFVAKMNKDKRLNELKSVDLRYKRQVVTIKKQVI
jgi:cell division protein FtsQ